MFKQRSFFTGLALLSVLLVLTQASSHVGVQASPPSQDVGPSQQDGQPLSPLLPQAGDAPQDVYEINATPGVTYQTISSLLFTPVQGSTNWEYNYIYGTLILASPTTSAEFVYPLVLPDKVNIQELTFKFRDNQSDKDLLMGLCRVPLGVSGAGCLNWTVNSTGVNTTALVSRTLTGNPIVTVDNAGYSYFLVVTMGAVNSQFGLVSAQIGYSYSTYTPTIMR